MRFGAFARSKTKGKLRVRSYRPVIEPLEERALLAGGTKGEADFIPAI